MKKIIRIGLVCGLVIAGIGCSSESKKPDPVVIANSELNKTEENSAQAPLDTTNLTDAYQDTGLENYSAAETPDTGLGNKVGSNAAASNRQNATATTASEKNPANQVNTKPQPAGQTAPIAKVPVKAVTATRLSVQEQLARDARLANKMPLAKFGRYMERRADYYRSFGEVSYDDKTVEIKITREELKIQTPEGKYKRESDERKIKTAAGKVK